MPDKVLELQKDYAASDNRLSTFYHELLHWKDAQRYIKKYGTIKNQRGYLKSIIADSKKEVDKLLKSGYFFEKISNYASECISRERYDEIYTEFRVKKWSEHG